jgi:hypothetical protein
MLMNQPGDSQVTVWGTILYAIRTLDIQFRGVINDLPLLAFQPK